MEIDEEDDFYAPEEDVSVSLKSKVKTESVVVGSKVDEEGLEEGEEDEAIEEDSDSDIDIITEKKETSTPANVIPKQNEQRTVPQKSSTDGSNTRSQSIKKENKADKSPSGAQLPGIATSKIDVNAKPVYEPAGKPITEVNIDDDLVDHDKPWRRPGTDITDYFNYGFDEFTWALYCSKQENVRKEFDQDVLAQDQKKMFEQMNMMMGMGGMPGMPGMPGVGPGGMSMDGMPPEMQQMMQQMMASGMDPSQLDPSAMFGNGAGAGGNQAQAAYGAQGNFGQGGFGFDQSMNNTADNSGNRRGNFRGRGGRRGGW